MTHLKIEDRDDPKRQASEAFNDRAEHYAVDREQLPFYQAQLEFVHSMLAGQCGRVLDIGCAAGGDIPVLQRLGFSVIGIDLSPVMLSFARRRFAATGNVAFCRADIERLPFTSKSIDHVVCLGVLEFLPDYNSAMAEINRVLRIGGLVIFAIPRRFSLYNISERFANYSLRPLVRAFKQMRCGGSEVLLSKALNRNLCIPRKFRALLRQNGFEFENDRYSNFFIYPVDRFPKLHVAAAAALEPLASIPLLRRAASVYLVSARKK